MFPGLPGFLYKTDTTRSAITSGYAGTEFPRSPERESGRDCHPSKPLNQPGKAILAHPKKQAIKQAFG